MRLRTTTVLMLVLAACSVPGEDAPTTTTTTRAPSAQDLIALEGTPGSSPPLVDAGEPAAPPVAGLEGTPGPSPAFGPETAPVRIWVFTDFQCPVCRRVVEPMKHLARTFPQDVRLVFKNNALPLHARAARVAAAGIAASRQGKFWAFHDLVFSHPGQLDDDTLVAHAQTLGLDVPRFRRDMDDEPTAAQVRYETALAGRLGLRGTPGFLVNGTPQVGWGSYYGMASMVERELARARTLAASGVPADRVAYEATRQVGPKGPEMAAALISPRRD